MRHSAPDDSDEMPPGRAPDDTGRWRRRRTEGRAVGTAKVGKAVGAVYQSSWVRAGEYASAADVGAIPIVSIVEIPQAVAGGLDQTGLLDLGGPIPAVDEVQAPAAEAAGVAKNSAIMALGTLASRLAGLLRQVILTAAIGSGLVSNAYTQANNLPNQVYELLIGGVLASVVVPLLVKAQKTDADKGEAFIQRLLTITVSLGTLVTVLAVLAAPLLTRAVNDNAATAPLTTAFGYLILVEIVFYAIAAVLGAILNSRGKFAATAWVPVLNSVIVVLTAAVFIALNSGKTLSLTNITTTQIAVLGIGTTLGIAVQAIALWFPLRKLGFRWKWRWDWRGAGLGEARSLAGWLMLYVLFSQIGLTVVQRVASHASGSGPGGPTIYNNAFMLFQLPHGIVAVSVITALLPRMSRAAVEGRLRSIADDLSLGTRLSSTLLIPATGIMLFLGPSLGALLFRYGQTSDVEATLTGQVFAFAGLGLLPFAISQMQTFVFYAMRDAKTAALVNVAAVAVRVIGALVVQYLVTPAFALQGLMIVNGISYLAAMVIGGMVLRGKLGRLHLGKTLSTVVRVAIASTPAMLIALVIQVYISHFFPVGRLGNGLSLFLGLTIGGGIYLGLAVLLRVREIRDVLAQIRRRVVRR
ncbi:murein biosynthesis integral membrane protein MurJ [Fodinicola feengrottensis]|uniref:Murein biosynthesis integral membrane protein MurJ n=1 Tax=Fodinicola feengrottensis TaxID=435914 RepID=A0ABN2GWN2_9ACTN